jgi:hypothetical protein
VYSAKGYGGSYDAQPSIYRCLNWSLFSCHSKFYHLLQNLGLFKNVATQFIGRQGLLSQSTTKMPGIDRKIRILYHTFTYANT